jgi:hypothetical protein
MRKTDSYVSVPKSEPPSAAEEPRTHIDRRCECTHGSPERRCGDEALYVVTREDGSILQVCGNCTFASDQQRSPITAPEAEPPPERCERCGWPLAASIEEGCTRGNCSMRCACPGAHVDGCPLRRVPAEPSLKTVVVFWVDEPPESACQRIHETHVYDPIRGTHFIRWRDRWCAMTDEAVGLFLRLDAWTREPGHIVEWSRR